MSSVKEIERAVSLLAADDLMAFRDWFAEFDAEAWDAQIERDAAAGKLDALANEAMAEYKAGKATEICAT